MYVHDPSTHLLRGVLHYSCPPITPHNNAPNIVEVLYYYFFLLRGFCGGCVFCRRALARLDSIDSFRIPEDPCILRTFETSFEDG